MTQLTRLYPDITYQIMPQSFVQRQHRFAQPRAEQNPHSHLRAIESASVIQNDTDPIHTVAALILDQPG